MKKLFILFTVLTMMISSCTVPTSNSTVSSFSKTVKRDTTWTYEGSPDGHAKVFSKQSSQGTPMYVIIGDELDTPVSISIK